MGCEVCVADTEGTVDWVREDLTEACSEETVKTVKLRTLCSDGQT